MSSQVFHPTCGKHHRAAVSLDANGYPVTDWLETCPDQQESAPYTASKQWHLRRDRSARGRGLGPRVDVGDWDRAEEFLEQVMARNDPPKDVDA